jgi:ppGpp synthetase/RelA/SpoT-type nucleotidyltranferase
MTLVEEQKLTYEQYCEQLLKDCREKLFLSESYYETYLNGLTSEIKASRFNDILRALSGFQEQYVQSDMLFLTDPSSVTLKHKPLKSVLNKIYRLNCVRRRKDDIDLTLENFHHSLDDLFRTRFICKYMDGPEFVCNRLKETCNDVGIESHYHDITTRLGYHAWHFYYKQPIEDFGGAGPAQVFVELQFTTQLAEVIGSLTHIQYEAVRLGEQPPPGWRWNVNSKEFRPYYIGHGLHLLEGIILEFRNSVLPAKKVAAEEEKQPNWGN